MLYGPVDKNRASRVNSPGVSAVWELCDIAKLFYFSEPQL